MKKLTLQQLKGLQRHIEYCLAEKLRYKNLEKMCRKQLREALS